MFMIENVDELNAFITANSGKERIEWKVQGDRLYFMKDRVDVKEIPNTKMIALSLEYATELNRII
jgi:hypothetical protein